MAEEQREVDHRNKAFPIRLNHRSRRRSLPELLPEDSADLFQVISVLSYGNNRNNAGKSAKIFDKDLRVIPDGAGNDLMNPHENSKRQTSTSFSTHWHGQDYGNSQTPTTRLETTRNKKHDLTDWLLLGKSIQGLALHSDDTSRGNFNNEVYFLPRKTKGSCKNPLCKASHTYSLSVGFEKCSNSEHLTAARERNSEGFYSEEKGRLLRSFSSRPLGKTWSSYSERQKSRHETGGERMLDELIAAGRRFELSHYSRSSPSGYKRPTELRRTSSYSNLKKFSNVARFRSASLPQSKLDCHVVFDWKEKRNDGITYVTPFLQSSSFEKPFVSSIVDYRKSTDKQETIKTEKVPFSEVIG